MNKNINAIINNAFEAIQQQEFAINCYLNKNPDKSTDINFIKRCQKVEAVKELYNLFVDTNKENDLKIKQYQISIMHLQNAIERIFKCMILANPDYAMSVMNYYDIDPDKLDKLLIAMNKLNEKINETSNESTKETIINSENYSLQFIHNIINKIQYEKI